MSKRYSMSGVLTLAFLWLVWGGNWIVTKLGLAYASAAQLGLLRTVLAIATLGVILLLSKRPLRPPPFVPTFLLGLTQTAGFVLLTNLALAAGGAGKVSVLCYTMPFWTLLLARVYLGERLLKVQWLAVGLAFVGLLAILEPWNLSGGWLSDVLAIGGGLVWAVAAIIAKKLRTRHQVDTLGLTFWQMLWGAVPLLLLLPLFPAQPLVFSWPLLWVSLFAGVLAGGLGWLAWMSLLTRLSAGMAGLNILAVPAVAVMMAWLALGEVPTLAEGLGMGLVTLALGLLAGVTLWRERKSSQVR
ncbi:DMT family transporter [Craterilacuibacter sp. RT1T]|uniref:DMT family transporter n=1 Tax=Craterilacuibacter sp. RT1T TaxID=2942211 RepID=UPI0020BEAC95|nr:DMT family transporter [Craterilacuibacter sp. RT1T]MCL6263784.1 DMT family transporter [Craterilacuibacter sp. RT1T]